MGRVLTRLSVDIGGTFTDVVLEKEGQLFSTKLLTTYFAPEDAIINGMKQVCDKARVKIEEIKQVIHGTTLATNALIERKGAKTALITTQGFRDVIEMRTESRFEQYDLNLKLPEPLLPRWQRYVLEERIDARGEILIPLEKDNIYALIEEIKQANYDSIAIGFMHAYLNDKHERMVRDILTQELPNLMISISSEVSPQMREYERFNTVIANAYIKPLIKSYLDRLADKLQHEGLNCPIFLMHSGGGIISLKDAAEFPVRLVESGPAGGAVFAAHIAARYGLDKVLSFDMGGTTAKICLIQNQNPKTARVFEVARSYRFKKGSGMPISIPVIDMVEIGAGGGSLAHVDALNQIRVGPESAGADPGPACYGQGGERPAVSDADLILGKIDPDNFAGGSIKLSKERSQEVILKTIGIQLNMDVLTAAHGIQEMVDENMANAARVHAVENGEDLSDYTMIAFGGAAPLHAARLCEKLAIDRLLVPLGAGVGSAIGFLRAPFSFETNRSIYMNLSDFDDQIIRSLFLELEDEAVNFVKNCAEQSEITAEYKAYMRYQGQGWEIPIHLSKEQALNPDADQFKNLFEQSYSNLFGRVVDGMEIEILVWSVNAATRVEKVTSAKELKDIYEIGSEKMQQIFDPALGYLKASSIIERHTMKAGTCISGPAAIVEDETTTIIPTSRKAIMQSDGSIDVIARDLIDSDLIDSDLITWNLISGIDGGAQQ